MFFYFLIEKVDIIRNERLRNDKQINHPKLGSGNIQKSWLLTKSQDHSINKIFGPYKKAKKHRSTI